MTCAWGSFHRGIHYLGEFILAMLFSTGRQAQGWWEGRGCLDKVIKIQSKAPTGFFLGLLLPFPAKCPISISVVGHRPGLWSCELRHRSMAAYLYTSVPSGFVAVSSLLSWLPFTCSRPWKHLSPSYVPHTYFSSLLPDSFVAAEGKPGCVLRHSCATKVHLVGVGVGWRRLQV